MAKDANPDENIPIASTTTTTPCAKFRITKP